MKLIRLTVIIVFARITCISSATSQITASGSDTGIQVKRIPNKTNNSVLNNRKRIRRIDVRKDRNEGERLDYTYDDEDNELWTRLLEMSVPTTPPPSSTMPPKTPRPTETPTGRPTKPTKTPRPTKSPKTDKPSRSPTKEPTKTPTPEPTKEPTEPPTPDPVCGAELSIVCQTAGDNPIACEDIPTPEDPQCATGEELDALDVSWENRPCSESQNGQRGNFKCEDFTGVKMGEEAEITCYNSQDRSDLYCQCTTVSKTTLTGPQKSLPEFMTCEIGNADGEVAQNITFATSGDIDLRLGDTYGMLTIDGCSDVKGSFINKQCCYDVDYLYVLSNKGDDFTLVGYDRDWIEKDSERNLLPLLSPDQRFVPAGEYLPTLVEPAQIDVCEDMCYTATLTAVTIDVQCEESTSRQDCFEGITTRPPVVPTATPPPTPTLEPTRTPPTNKPTPEQTTESPTILPPTEKPTRNPTKSPTFVPTNSPTLDPTRSPTPEPTPEPTPGDCDVDVEVECITDDGTLCSEIEPVNGQCSRDKAFTELVLAYAFSPCDESENGQQDKDNSSCQDEDDFEVCEKASIVMIRCYDVESGENEIFSGKIPNDQTFALVSEGDSTLPASIVCVIHSSDEKSVCQEIQLDTSGNADLYLKDRFGSLTIQSCADEDGDIGTCYAKILHTYDITNSGDVDLTVTKIKRTRDGETDDLVGEIDKDDRDVSPGSQLSVAESESVDLCMDNCFNTTIVVRAEPTGGDSKCSAKETSDFCVNFQERTPSPTSEQTLNPTKMPTTEAPTPSPTTLEPTTTPTHAPTRKTTASPTKTTTTSPTKEPTASPTKEPTASPTKEPTASPTKEPTASPTKEPTASPTKEPTKAPTAIPVTPSSVSLSVSCETIPGDSDKDDPVPCEDLKQLTGDCSEGDALSRLVFSYTGRSCDDSENDQSSENFSCIDFSGCSIPEGEKAAIFCVEGDKVYGNYLVDPGVQFVVQVGEDESLPGSLNCTIANIDREICQRVIFDASGDSTLNLKDKFGSLTIDGCDDISGSLNFECIVEADYIYITENDVDNKKLTATELNRTRNGESRTLASGFPVGSFVTEPTAIDICTGMCYNTKAYVDAVSNDDGSFHTASDEYEFCIEDDSQNDSMKPKAANGFLDDNDKQKISNASDFGNGKNQEEDGETSLADERNVDAIGGGDQSDPTASVRASTSMATKERQLMPFTKRGSLVVSALVAANALVFIFT